MAKRQTSTQTKDKAAEHSDEDLKALVAKGEPLPSGYAYNPRRRPSIYRVDSDQESGPGPEQGSPAPSGSTQQDSKPTE